MQKAGDSRCKGLICSYYESWGLEGQSLDVLNARLPVNEVKGRKTKILEKIRNNHIRRG